MHVEKWKGWFQVKDNGYTVFQTRNKREADMFVASGEVFPAASLHLGEEGVSQKIGTTIRKISKYP